jgi:hypothetical protein
MADMGFSAGVGVAIGAVASVIGCSVLVVSMVSFRVVVLRCRLQKPKPGKLPGTRGFLGQRVVLKGVSFLPHFNNHGSTMKRFHWTSQLGPRLANEKFLEGRK